MLLIHGPKPQIGEVLRKIPENSQIFQIDALIFGPARSLSWSYYRNEAKHEFTLPIKPPKPWTYDIVSV